MGTTLTGTTPQDTYDSLIKVTDNGPISGTLKALSDGLGNDSTLSLSTTAASIAGTLAVAGDFSIADKIVHIGDTNTAIRFPAADTITFETSGAEALRIGSTGLVGIGKTSPTNPLHILKAESSVLLGGLKIERDPNTSTSAIFNAFGGGAFIVANSGVTSSFTSPIVFAVSDNTTTTEIARVTANGLTFNGDTAAANALDDYEEGTFTPTIIGTTTAGTATYGGGQSGLYTKIGRIVYVSIYLSYSGGTGTGDLRIAGLPFTIAAADVPSFSIGAFSDVALTASNVPVAFAVGSGTQININQLPVGGGTQSTVPYDGTGVIVMSGFYQV